MIKKFPKNAVFSLLFYFLQRNFIVFYFNVCVIHMTLMYVIHTTYV